MTQPQVLLLLLKIGIPLAFASLIQWIVVYSVLERHWYRQAIGQTLVAKTLLVAGLLAFTGLSVFFSLNRETSEVIAWVETIFIYLITPVMIWRSVVWWRVAHTGKKAGDSLDNTTEKR